MTMAACYQCGAWKFGALTKCPACAAVPSTEDDIMVSMILTDEPHNGSTEEWQRRIDIIKSGRKFTIKEPAASQLREAARDYLRRMGPNVTGDEDEYDDDDDDDYIDRITGRSENASKSEGRKQGKHSKATAEAGSGGDKQSLLSSFLFSAGIWAFGLLSMVIVLALAFLLVVVGLLHTDPSSDWPTFFAQFIPPSYLATLASAFHVSRFENQRWTRARARGLVGASEGAGLLVDFTGSIAWFFSKVILFALWFDIGWQQTLGLFLISQLALNCWLLIKGDSLFRWVTGTILVWPLMFLLAWAVTWFGYLSL